MISIVVSGEVSMLWVGDFDGICLLMEKLRGSLPTSLLVDKYEVKPKARVSLDSRCGFCSAHLPSLVGHHVSPVSESYSNIHSHCPYV